MRALPFEFDIIFLQLIENGWEGEKKLAPFGDDRGNGDAFNCQDLRQCLLCCALDTRESFLSKMTLSRALKTEKHSQANSKNAPTQAEASNHLMSPFQL
jgi:hypothetical protein